MAKSLRFGVRVFLTSVENQGARSIQPKFQPVRPGKVVHLKRWTSFFETLSVGPNRSIEFWTEIAENFGWIERRSVTSGYQHYFWMTTKPTTTATSTFILTNYKFASRYFVHFFAAVAPLRLWKLPNFSSPLYGVGEQNTKVVAFLL